MVLMMLIYVYNIQSMSKNIASPQTWRKSRPKMCCPGCSFTRDRLEMPFSPSPRVLTIQSKVLWRGPRSTSRGFR